MSGIVRSITHWTAGGGRASPTDKKHYHRITERDGRIVDGDEAIRDNIVTSDGDYAAHTLRLNTGSAGFSMAGMRDARDIDTADWFGPSPINERQFESHCKMLAEFHMDQGIPVTPRTCLTHAEVEPTLGVKQRGKWDFTRLPFKPGLRGALPVGNYMRERVLSYTSVAIPALNNRPILREGDKGLFVEEMQELMSGIGVFSGRIDGHFGPRTAKAVLAVQRHAGLDTDGVVGPHTWEALMVAPPLPARDVDEVDLRRDGSRTIADADTAQTEAKAAGAGVIGLGTLDVALETADKVSDAGSSLEAAQSVLISNWPIFIIIGLGVLAYFRGPAIMAAIRSYRVEDARTGANLKR